jgi:hypothetical protein
VLFTLGVKGLRQYAVLHKKKRGVASLERDNLAVFYYLRASANWPDKEGGLS